MSKKATDVVITLVAVLVYLADTVHITLENLGFGGPMGRLSCWGLTRMFGPMLHIPDACALDAVWMTAMLGGLLTCWAKSSKVLAVNNVIGIAAVAYFALVTDYAYLVGLPLVTVALFAVTAVVYAYRIFVLFRADLALYRRLYAAFATVAAVFLVLGMYSLHNNYHLVASNIAVFEYMNDAFNTYKKWARDQKFPHQCAPTPALVEKAEEELTLIQYFPLWAVIVIMVVVPAIFIGGALALEKKPDRGQAVASDDFDEELMDYGEDDGEDDEDGGL